MLKNKIVITIFFLLAIFLVYKSFFTTFPLAFGDAPYFYSDKLKELFNPPFSWDYRTENFGNFQGLVIWLYLPTFLMGLIYQIFRINPDFLNHLVFYFPTVLLAFAGSFLLIKKYLKDNKSALLGSLFYIANTYILSIIDGGQLGVALGYGIFPFAILGLINLISEKSISNFWLCLLWLFLLSNTDLRIFIILPIAFLAVFAALDTSIFSKVRSSLITLGLLILLLFSLSFYWLLPLWQISKITDTGLTVFKSSSLFDLLHPMLLYHPNFPLNQFGTVIFPKTYFVVIPLLLVISLWIGKNERKLLRSTSFLVLAFLSFAFLAKGGGDPLGNLYVFFTSNIPFGFAFRDSTKFYIPLILIFSFILSLNINYFSYKYQKSRNHIFVLVFLWILLMVNPVIFGQMSGILGVNQSTEHKKIAQKISQSSYFYRTVFFPENTPFSYNSWSKPVISAINLHRERPLASLISGNYDLYYFLHDPNINDWFRLLGVKYIVIDQNYRQKIWTEQELKDRGEFLRFIDKIFGNNDQSSSSKKEDWSSYIPVYELANPLPHIFLQKKAFLVIGGETIYDYLFRYPEYKLENNGFIFSEYKDTDLGLLANVHRDSLVLIFNDTSKIDLTMSFLKTKLQKNNRSFESNFGFYESIRYLDWKYELLKHGINTKDLDYGEGAFTSTKKSESIKFTEKNLPTEFYLAIRYTNASDSSGLQVTYLNREEVLFNAKTDHFAWKLIGPIKKEKDTIDVFLTNRGGFNTVNIFAVIDKKDFIAAQNKSDFFLKKYRSYYVSPELLDQGLLAELENNYKVAQYNQKNPTEYLTTKDKEYSWLTFTDHYEKNWSLSGQKPLPFYNMVNGFYIRDIKANNLRLYFVLQDDQNKATLLSVLSLLVIVMGTIMILVYRKYVRKN